MYKEEKGVSANYTSDTSIDELDISVRTNEEDGTQEIEATATNDISNGGQASTGETNELANLRAMRDQVAEEVEKLRQQTKSAEQLLASYDALLKGKTQDKSQNTEAKGEQGDIMKEEKMLIEIKEKNIFIKVISFIKRIFSQKQEQDLPQAEFYNSDNSFIKRLEESKKTLNMQKKLKAEN